MVQCINKQSSLSNLSSSEQCCIFTKNYPFSLKFLNVPCKKENAIKKSKPFEKLKVYLEKYYLYNAQDQVVTQAPDLFKLTTILVQKSDAWIYST